MPLMNDRPVFCIFASMSFRLPQGLELSRSTVNTQQCEQR